MVLGLPGQQDDLPIGEIEEKLLKRVDELNISLIADARDALVDSADSGEPVEFESGDTIWWGEARAIFDARDFGNTDDPDSAIVAVIVPVNVVVVVCFRFQVRG